MAVRGVRGVRPQHEEDVGEGECEYHEQHIPSREEEGACHDHEDNVTQDVKVLGHRDYRILLFEKLQDIIKRLEDWRPDTALHPGSHLPVDTGNQATEDRCENDIYQCIEDRIELHGDPISTELIGDHKITPRSIMPAMRS